MSVKKHAVGKDFKLQERPVDLILKVCLRVREGT